MKYLRSLGLGLVTIILLPILLAGIILVGVFMLFEWIIMFFKGAIRFFKGDTFFVPLPEDVMVEEIKAKELRSKLQEDVPPAPAPAPAPTQQNVYVTNYYQYPNQNPQTPPQNPYINNPYGAQAPGQFPPPPEPDFIEQKPEEIPFVEESANKDTILLDLSDSEEGGEQ